MWADFIEKVAMIYGVDFARTIEEKVERNVMDEVMLDMAGHRRQGYTGAEIMQDAVTDAMKEIEMELHDMIREG